MVYLTQAQQKSIDNQVENEALNSFQGETFDMMDFVLTKAMIRNRIMEDLKEKEKDKK